MRTTEATELSSERDQNFLVAEEGGRKSVLKISNESEEGSVLESQIAALEHLAARQEAPLYPRPFRGLNGDSIHVVEGRDGARHFVRMLSFLEGRFLAEVRPHRPELLLGLGRFFAAMDRALMDFSHPGTARDLRWDLKHAPEVIGTGQSFIESDEDRTLVRRVLDLFEREVGPRLSDLRQSVIHNDGNDHNVLVRVPPLEERSPYAEEIAGVIDFGDLVATCTVGDLAICAAYAVLNKENPLAAAAEVVRGYDEILPLTDAELEVLFPLICTRLATSVTLSAYQHRHDPHNAYLRVSEAAAWTTLRKFAGVNHRFACCLFRSVCRRDPCPGARRVTDWLASARDRIGPIVDCDLKTGERVFFDLGVDSPEFGSPPCYESVHTFTDALFARMRAAQARVGIGRYDEARPMYTAEAFRFPSDRGPESRTVHLGVDLFLEPGTAVRAPLAGTVHSFRNNAGNLDYGPTIVLQHEMGAARSGFFTLYGHLSEDSVRNLEPGMRVERGARIGAIGSSAVNGGWPPHLHFQIIVDMLGREGDFPGTAAPSERAAWLSLCPDPNLVLGIPEGVRADPRVTRVELLEARSASTSRSLRLSYKRPLQIVRGYMQHLYDADGRVYLDAVNNVPHVGHCHPRVVEAARRQIAVLNTNTRYLHERLVRYARRLCATLPEPLRICFLVNSGSEANDLALRLARAHTRSGEVVVLDGAYHGNLTSLIEISPYKFDGPGGGGAPSHVHKLAMPDRYRGAHGYGDPAAGEKYAREAAEVIRGLRERGRGAAAFICESALSCGGQIFLPDGYLEHVYGHVREAGGVCIADEVQVGFGRLGTHFWGFQTQGVVPDIVTMGKPIGNGHPVAAVVTTPAIAASFETGMEYFNTFGGNPVSCAVGEAVLAVLEEEGLQARALRVGERLKDGLELLMAEHALIGDVRGTGLFAGIELVTDRPTRRPAARHASYVVERMKERGVLVSTDGPLENVIKIKPPMVFSDADAELLVQALDGILSEDCLFLP